MIMIMIIIMHMYMYTELCSNEITINAKYNCVSTHKHGAWAQLGVEYTRIHPAQGSKWIYPSVRHIKQAPTRIHTCMYTCIHTHTTGKLPARIHTYMHVR